MSLSKNYRLKTFQSLIEQQTNETLFHRQDKTPMNIWNELFISTLSLQVICEKNLIYRIRKPNNLTVIQEHPKIFGRCEASTEYDVGFSNI